MFRFVLLGFLGSLGCASGSTQIASAPPALGSSALGPGDVFEVRVFGEESLSGVYRVAPTGSINFPMVGQVLVDGQSDSDVALILEEKLRAFLKSPSVSIFVKEFNSKKIYVFGQVRQPGTFVYESGMNIIQAITLAGGFDVRASSNGTQITRVVEGAEQRMDIDVDKIGKGAAPNFELRPGDIVFVPESLF